MGAIAVSGSASGIGAAIAARLVRDGHRVVGVDLRDADVVADLATSEGRAAAVRGVEAACDGALDGLVTCAGITGADARVVSVNYFGTVALLEGLRPALERGVRPAAVAIGSISATLVPYLPQALIDACLQGDEAAARKLADKEGWSAYGGSKLAVAHFVRRAAVGPDWAGAGIRLNAVSPGRIRTPMDDAMLADEEMRPLLESLPIPLGQPGRPEDVAGVVRFLLSPESGYFCGSVVTVDGGTEALVRPDAWPSIHRG